MLGDVGKRWGQSQYLKVNRQGHFSGVSGAVLGTFPIAESPDVAHGPVSSKLLGVIM